MTKEQLDRIGTVVGLVGLALIAAPFVAAFILSAMGAR